MKLQEQAPPLHPGLAWPPVVGVTEEVEASHCTAPYCAVKLVDANGTTEPDSGLSVKVTDGACVNPVVAQGVESLWVKAPPPPVQKLPVATGLNDSLSDG